MKKIIIAPDSFKGNMTASEVSDHIENGIRRFTTDCEIVKIPLSDGGEGMTDVITSALDGKFIDVTVKNPLFRDIIARYGISGDTAIIEMASASGIDLLDMSELNPLKTTTYGTGELMLDALKKGCKKIIVGLGGSATNDGGVGMASALGVKFLNADGNEIIPCGGELNKIEKIDVSGITPLLKDVEIIASCDVKNTLCGKNGASYVFGPQKGASEAVVKELDANMMHYAQKIQEYLNCDVLNKESGGAAGGLASGLYAFCNAEICGGFDTVSKTVGLKEKMQGADLVITGEGCTDFQTAFGKLPGGVASVAKSLGIPCIVISGSVKGDISPLYDCGVTAAFATVTTVTTLDKALSEAVETLERTAYNIARLFFVKK